MNASNNDGGSRKGLDFEHMASLKHWGGPPGEIADTLQDQIIVDCGWGRLVFGQTFRSSAGLAKTLLGESLGHRDVGLYIRDPQVVISRAPQQLFIDPSLTYRLDLTNASLPTDIRRGVTIRRLRDTADEAEINRIYKMRDMVTVREGFYRHHDSHPELTILIAVDSKSDNIVGCVTGVDHFKAFSDPDNGSSLWALAVDPQCAHPGIGETLVIALARQFADTGRSFMDLSVMHDNSQAISLYKKLGFYQVPVYCIKTKNAINEKLFVGNQPQSQLNIYARIIVDEAYRRGIVVDIVDAEGGFFDLSLGGRTVSCRESLTELTSAVAMSRCDDKVTTQRFLKRAGLSVPAQRILGCADDAVGFLEEYHRIVVKPARGEQGAGVRVDLQQPENVISAFNAARKLCDRVIGELYVEGKDLRVIVINDEVVAAAIRRPAAIIGDGVLTIADLITKQSRRRSAATGGESTIPMDDETERCVTEAGFDLESVLAHGQSLNVRKTANLHTGGTLHDVTHNLHPALVDAALTGARVLNMPLVGFDFLVEDVNLPRYVIIEANERPGLANHEPQPTAERLLDMLFPQTALNQH
ncbi:MAG: glutathione synthase [marine bacterium B5-7]|nr:MAG: glutathione synthase [marine bacterium B5-7]